MSNTIEDEFAIDATAEANAETEPSLSEQWQAQEQQANIRNEIFNKTGLKVASDDPIIQLMLVIERITTEHVETIANNLESHSENIIDNITHKQEQVVTEFDNKLVELNELLTKLQDQKEAIVIDVWRKLEQRVMDKIQTELTDSIQTIAKNSNNNVNNERMLLKGGVGGLIVGIILCAILLFVFK